MRKLKKVARGPCLWPDCPEGGVFFSVRLANQLSVKGYWCDAHERKVATENLERLRDRAFWERHKRP